MIKKIKGSIWFNNIHLRVCVNFLTVKCCCCSGQVSVLINCKARIYILTDGENPNTTYHLNDKKAIKRKRLLCVEAVYLRVISLKIG